MNTVAELKQRAKEKDTSGIFSRPLVEAGSCNGARRGFLSNQGDHRKKTNC